MDRPAVRVLLLHQTIENKSLEHVICRGVIWMNDSDFALKIKADVFSRVFNRVHVTVCVRK